MKIRDFPLSCNKTLLNSFLGQQLVAQSCLCICLEDNRKRNYAYLAQRCDIFPASASHCYRCDPCFSFSLARNTMHQLHLNSFILDRLHNIDHPIYKLSRIRYDGDSRYMVRWRLGADVRGAGLIGDGSEVWRTKLVSLLASNTIH